ncbi:MAG TPA: ribonuclease [Sphingomicrobium sp.]|nr:ribonuclease [Sphingomicrobium sp.]
MPDWLAEQGIGETRYALVEDGEIVAARITLDGTVRAGTLLEAQIRQVARPTIAVAAGQEYLLPCGAPGLTEGATATIEVTREAIPGGEPWKRPLARLARDPQAPGDERSPRAIPFPSPLDRLQSAGWWDLLDEARTGAVRFAGGELRLSPTPAMTLIDVDGYLPAKELALAGAAAAARSIRRLDIGGSIGIDLPTIAGKAERQAIGEAVDEILPGPFERTAVNGFGFMQIVRQRRRASLLELAQDRASFEARDLLRRAAFAPPGAKRLVAHPAVVSYLETQPGWLAAIAAQVGGGISLRSDPSLPMSGGYAEQA